MVLDGVSEQLVLLLAEFYFADYCLGHVTLVLDLDAAVLELHAEQILAQSLMIVVYGGFGTRAERQRKIRISLLTVMVWAHRVHPEDYLVVQIVLVIVLVTADACQQ